MLHIGDIPIRHWLILNFAVFVDQRMSPSSAYGLRIWNHKVCYIRMFFYKYLFTPDRGYRFQMDRSPCSRGVRSSCWARWKARALYFLFSNFRTLLTWIFGRSRWIYRVKSGKIRKFESREMYGMDLTRGMVGDTNGL